jgi:uncharacterized protein (TIGR03083 family)
MTLADRTIAQLRRVHDDLAARVATFTDDDLARTSGSSDWTVAQVLSHLGSAAEIRMAGLDAALTGGDPPGQDFNPGVWDRWNAKAPRAQAEDYIAAEAACLALVEGLTPEQRDELLVPVGFLPQPLDVASWGALWLNESAQHSWDVRVAGDADARVDAAAADVLLEHFTGALGFLLGFSGKADALDGEAAVAIGDTDLVLSVTDTVALASGVLATATWSGGSETVIRLFGGRLKPPYIPADLTVSGNVTLDDLRRVFPGY